MQIETHIDKVVETISAGGIICIPTDTLFALSCDATNPIAIQSLYNLKKRDMEKKLPIFFSDIEHAQEHCIIHGMALDLANKFWPGKLTMVLKLKENSDIATNAFDIEATAAAVRIPGDKMILKIIKTLNKPIIGTSANISGSANINSYQELEMQFKNENILIVKQSHNEFNPTLQSTIITFKDNQPIILREGAIPQSDILKHQSPELQS
jgi:L-threonylcarbamoyladenylate synthase